MFRKIQYFILFGVLGVNAQNFEDKFYKDSTYVSKGFGMHNDLAYSSYLIEVDSSEIDAVIDYDLLEYTLGVSYVYGSLMFGMYMKLLVDEIGSNMYFSTTQKSLGDRSNIDKNEFSLYLNYHFFQEEKSSCSLNLIYRESMFKARNSYQSFHYYSSYFHYKSKGLALSLVYTGRFLEKNSYFLSTGMLYSQANVQVNERINNILQDAFIDEQSQAVGLKLALGYNYNFSENLILNLRIDTWWLNFSKLKVQSKVGDTLPSARLKEESSSSYLGFTWRF
jgi:hypothetical protein